MDAKRNTVQQQDALAILSEVDEVYSMKGKRVVHLNLRKETPARAELEALLLGPTGNLRAPAIRKGRTLLVGFDEETFRRVLG